MSDILPFQFDHHAIRVQIGEGGEPWFVAADVCAALDLPETHKAVARLDDDEKDRNSIPTPGGIQEMTVVNESGLFNLVLGSRKPEAKRFKRWVTHEVLPSIRKTGSYAMSGATAVLPAPTQDRVASLLLIGDAVAKVPGVKFGIAMAATLTCIQENTGLGMETLRRALPPANEPLGSLNATQVGELAGLSPKAANLRLRDLGLQFRNERGDWELTEPGQAHAEAVPFSRHGHAGYQILWKPEVVGLLQETA